MSMKGINAEISKLESQRNAAIASKIKLARETQVYCAKCKEFYPARTFSFIQKSWYVSPHGCTGGDYWVQSEFNVCDMECGSGHKSYIYTHPQCSTLESLLDRHITPGALFKCVRKGD